MTEGLPTSATSCRPDDILAAPNLLTGDPGLPLDRHRQARESGQPAVVEHSSAGIRLHSVLLPIRPLGGDDGVLEITFVGGRLEADLLRETYKILAIQATVEGEAPELYAFLGSSRLEEPLLKRADWCGQPRARASPVRPTAVRTSHRAPRVPGVA